MFHKMITRKRDIWYQSADCKVNEIINYVEKQNQMRDAQIEAIKTYLFLKIACENQPLYQLFTTGAFNSIILMNLNFLQPHEASLMSIRRLLLKNDLIMQPKSRKRYLTYNFLDYFW